MNFISISLNKLLWLTFDIILIIILVYITARPFLKLFDEIFIGRTEYIRITFSYKYKEAPDKYFYHHMGFKITNNKYPTSQELDKKFKKENYYNRYNDQLFDIKLFSYEEINQNSVDLISKLEGNDNFFTTLKKNK